MSSQAFTFSGEAAKNYDHYLGPFLFEPSALITSAMVPRGFQGRVLEIAAGTGRLTKHLVRRLENASQLIATDLNADMLEVAKQRVDNSDIRYQVEDMQHLSFPDNSFDLVLCQYGIMFPPDKQKCLQEMYRVLKPGGILIFSTWDDTANIPFFSLVFNETLLPFFKTADKSKYVMPFHMHDPEALGDLLKKAGFRHTHVEKKSFKGTSPSPDDLVNGFIYKHQLGNEIKEQEPEAVERFAVYLHDEIGKRFGESPVVCELSAYFCQGVK